MELSSKIHKLFSKIRSFPGILRNCVSDFGHVRQHYSTAVVHLLVPLKSSANIWCRGIGVPVHTNARRPSADSVDQGLLPAQLLHCLDFCREQIQHDRVPWALLHVAGAVDTPVAWGAREHSYNLSGENGYSIAVLPQGRYVMYVMTT